MADFLHFKDSVSNYALGFGQSAIEGAGELIGIEPSLSTKKWRQGHPLGGFISSVATPLGYGATALKIGRMGRFGKAVDSIAESQWPVLKYAVREAARFAPFEIGRVGLTAATGGDTEEVFLDSLINIGIGSAVGGTLGVLESAGKSLRSKWGLFGQDITAPKQLQARSLVEDLKAGRVLPELEGEAKSQLQKWKEYVHIEQPTGKAVTRELHHGNAREVSRLFKPRKDQTAHMVLMPIRDGKRGFSQRAGLDQALGRFTLPEDWEFFAQYPRIHVPLTQKAKGALASNLHRNFKKVSDDTWFTREKDGLFVVGKQGQDDHWMFFKTDDVKKFADDGGLLNKIEERAAWYAAPSNAEREALKGSETLQYAHEFKQTIPFAMLTDVRSTRSMGQAIDQLSIRMAKFYGYGEGGEARRRAGAFLRRALSPTIHQFAKSPLGRWTYAGVRAVFDEANARSAEIMIGAKTLDRDVGILKGLARGVLPSGGLKKLIDALDVEDLARISSVMMRGGGIDDAVALGASDRVVNLLTTLDKIDGSVVKELQILQDMTGAKRVSPRRDHFMISRTYKGDWRQMVYDGQKLVAMGSGRTRKEAVDEAQKIVEYAQAQGKPWAMRNDPLTHDRAEDMSQLRHMSRDKEDFVISAEAREQKLKEARTPGFWTPRTEIEAGFRGHEATGLFTRDDLAEIISGHLSQNMKYIAEMSSRHVYGKEMAELAANDQNIAEQLEERINDLVGIKNRADRWQNSMVDKALSPVFGKNSASRMVRAFNEAMFTVQLGAFNLAYPVTSLLTFAQTVIPELAFVQYGAPARRMQYYDNWVVDGEKGIKTLGMLNAWKLQGQAFKTMSKPGDELLGFMNRGMREGTLEPRLMEEFIGPSARTPVRMREAIKGEGTWRWLKQISNFMPEAAERLSRAQAFSTGYLFGKDFLGLRDESLYRFTKQFTDRTMFGYGVADRPRMFTGPFGSSLGLFKNWQMHYIMNWMDYLGEGVSRNEWRPLLWSATGAAAVGGVPATGVGYLAADQMSRWLTDEPLMAQWYGAFERDPDSSNWSDAVWMGIPGFLPTLAGLPGISLTGQMSTPGGDPTRDLTMLMGMVHWDRMKAAGSAVSSAWDTIEATGSNPLRSEVVVGELLRAFAPKAIYRVQQSYADGVINSSNTLYPTITGLSPGETLLYQFGFNPHKVDLAYQASAELWADAERMKAATQALSEAWAEATLERDSVMQRRIMQEAMLKKIDFSKVLKGGAVRLGKARTDMFGRTFDDLKVQQWQSIGLLD